MEVTKDSERFNWQMPSTNEEMCTRIEGQEILLNNNERISKYILQLNIIWFDGKNLKWRYVLHDLGLKIFIFNISCFMLYLIKNLCQSQGSMLKCFSRSYLVWCKKFEMKVHTTWPWTQNFQFKYFMVHVKVDQISKCLSSQRVRSW